MLYTLPQAIGLGANKAAVRNVCMCCRLAVTHALTDPALPLPQLALPCLADSVAALALPSLPQPCLSWLTLLQPLPYLALPCLADAAEGSTAVRALPHLPVHCAPAGRVHGPQKPQGPHHQHQHQASLQRRRRAAQLRHPIGAQVIHCPPLPQQRQLHRDLTGNGRGSCGNRCRTRGPQSATY